MAATTKKPKKLAVKPTKNKKITPEQMKKLVDGRYGKGTMKFASDPSLEITRIPCGILSIDFRMGGGFARGRHTEIYGGWSIGKTTIALYLIAAIQRAGGHAAYVDSEGTFDPKYARQLGVKTKKLAYHRQQTGNRCIDFMETLLRSELYDVIVLDSIAALLPSQEVDRNMEQGTYGTQQAKLMSEALRRLTTANKNTVLVYINQTREAIGSMFGPKTVTSGGKAMGFYAGTRLDLARIENIKKTKMVIDPKTGNEKEAQVVKGHRVLVRVEKDKTGGAKQHDTTTFVFDYGLGGIDPVEDLIYVGRVVGAVHKKDSKWWVEGYRDETKDGRPAFKRWLRDNPEVQKAIKKIIGKHKETDSGED